MSFHLTIQGVFLLYGTAAIPCMDANSPLGCSGTTATCTTQGFFIYVTTITALFYYCTFSVYSFVGVLNNFESSKIIWVENYIHVFVHICPICSAFYIMSQHGFNDLGIGFCFLNGSPLGCWHDPSIPCEQSPESRMMNLLWLVPFLFVLIFPTIVMGILFSKVRQCQEQIFINATSVAKQAVRIKLFCLCVCVCVCVCVFIVRFRCPKCALLYTN